MGKCLTSLLVLVAAILLPDDIFADEQVRRVQEELRKRHLFYANPNGEKGPALTTAVRRYQLKKGFPATGIIDSVTLASLGISKGTPSAANTPVALGTQGQVHGANGERLAHSPFSRPYEGVSKFDPAFGEHDHLELVLEDFQPAGSRPQARSGERAHQTNAKDKNGARFQATFDLTNERIREAMADPAWNTALLPPPAEGPDEPVVIADDPARPTLRPPRRSQRPSRAVKQREERNPLVLTYQSLNRAIRSWFGDPPTKKKPSTSKRL